MRKRRAAILILAALVLGVYLGVRLLPPRCPGIPWYQGTAILGNGRLLVSLDRYGTITGFSWPWTGKYANMDIPRDREIPPSSGAFLGIRSGRRVIWLRDSRVLSQRYHPRSNVLETRYALNGMKITVTDFVLLGSDVLVRHIDVSPTPKDVIHVIAYQNFDLAGKTREDSGEFGQRVYVQERSDPDMVVALMGSVPPVGRRVGGPRSFSRINEARMLGGGRHEGDVVSAGQWPLGEDLTLVYSIARTRKRAIMQAEEALKTPIERLIGQTDEYWERGVGNPPEKVFNTPVGDEFVRSIRVLKLLQDNETGAIVGGPRAYWSYCWPRDGVFSAAALDLAGCHQEAERLYRFLARTQRPDGMWEARYEADGTPVKDGRATQIDAAGFFPWGVWLNVKMRTNKAFSAEMYPHVRKSARYILAHIDKETGLPGPSSDYWESSKHLDYYFSNAVVCWAGLTSAAEIAQSLGKKGDAMAFRQGAERIRNGVREHLWDGKKYVRSLNDFRGVDCAVCWAVSPFGMFPPDDPRVAATVKEIESRLVTRRGGVIPGDGWKGHDPWTHVTLFLASYHAARGNERQADAYLKWALDHATEAGTFPERISAKTGLPDSTTPIGWAHAQFILAVTERWGTPIPKP